MSISRVAFTAYPTHDVPRLRRWYEEHLGLVFAGAYVEDGVEKYNEAHLGESCFSIMSSEWLKREPGTASSIFFEVDDLDATIAALRFAGVAIEDHFEGPVCKQASLHDIDGNRLSLHQSTSRPSS